MIILLTGAGGTGKTTLAKAIAEEYDLHFLQSSSREVQKEFGIENEDDQLNMPVHHLTDLQNAITDRYWDSVQTAMYRFAEGDIKGYVADRTIADHFTYRIMKSWQVVRDPELELYQKRIEAQFIEGNPLVVHTPTGVFDPPKGNDLRTDSDVQRTLFDFIIRGVLDTIRPHINLLPMTVENFESRVKHIRTALINIGELKPESPGEERLLQE